MSETTPRDFGLFPVEERTPEDLRIIVTTQNAELARLRRVEQAARAYIDADPDVSDTLALYDALERAVGR